MTLPRNLWLFLGGAPTILLGTGAWRYYQRRTAIAQLKANPVVVLLPPPAAAIPEPILCDQLAGPRVLEVNDVALNRMPVGEREVADGAGMNGFLPKWRVPGRTILVSGPLPGGHGLTRDNGGRRPIMDADRARPGHHRRRQT
jgi:hypothetical protein